MHIETLTFTHTKGHRIFNLVLAIMIFVICVYIIIKLPSEEYFYLIFVIPTLLYIPFYILAEQKVKIILTQEFIQIKALFEKKIFFPTVKKVRFYRNGMILYGPKSKIEISGQFEKKEEIFEYVVNKINNIPNLEIKGFEDEIKKHFPR